MRHEHFIYRCVATNDFIKKTKKSKEAKLSVIPRLETNEPKTFLYPQISYNHWLLNGSNLNIVCAASGYPPAFITWSFLPKYSGKIEKNQVLFINPIFSQQITVGKTFKII